MWRALTPMTREQESLRKKVIGSLVLVFVVSLAFAAKNLSVVLGLIKTKVGILVMAVIFALGVYACIEPFLLEFTFNEIRVGSGYSPFTAVQISDVHLQWPYPYVTEKTMNKVVARINELQPDYVFVTGDLISRYRSESISKRNTEALYRSLSKLKPKLGSFAVLGNNDYCAKDMIIDILQRAGLRLLRNESVKLEGGVSLSGIDSCKSMDRVTKALSQFQVEDAPLKVVLAHEPDAAMITKDYFDLQISGHTHGGQVIIPFGGGPLILPTMGWRVPIGLHRVQKMLVYVTKGIGISPLPKPLVRFNARPEVSVLRIVPRD